MHLESSNEKFYSAMPLRQKIMEEKKNRKTWCKHTTWNEKLFLWQSSCFLFSPFMYEIISRIIELFLPWKMLFLFHMKSFWAEKWSKQEEDEEEKHTKAWRNIEYDFRFLLDSGFWVLCVKEFLLKKMSEEKGAEYSSFNQEDSFSVVLYSLKIFRTL